MSGRLGSPGDLTEKGNGTESFRLRRHQHSRTVSYDELHQMGLARAVDEYHKLIVSKPKSCGMAFCGSKKCCMLKFIACLALRPIPTLLRPECIICGCKTLWTTLMARLIRQSGVVLIPLALSYCVLPEQFSHVMPLLVRCCLLGIVVITVYIADKSLINKEMVCEGSVGESLVTYFGQELRMTTSETPDLSVLRLFDSREDIEARRKENQIVSRMKSLLLRYGFFSHGEEGHIANVFVAYQWITQLAEELGEDQLRQEENFTLDSALDAVSILEKSIGSH